MNSSPSTFPIFSCDVSAGRDWKEALKDGIETAFYALNTPLSWHKEGIVVGPVARKFIFLIDGFTRTCHSGLGDVDFKLLIKQGNFKEDILIGQYMGRPVYFNVNERWVHEAMIMFSESGLVVLQLMNHGLPPLPWPIQREDLIRVVE